MRPRSVVRGLAAVLLATAGLVPQRQLAWVQKVLIGESASSGPAMVDDTARGRLVLFGGYFGSGDETWEWDGISWTLRSPAVRPPGRAYHAMVYETARQRTVVFGGLVVNVGRSNDTWEYDGTTWAQRFPQTIPPARNFHSMAYDSLRGCTVLFGGFDGFKALGDTWEWDGTDWTLRTPLQSPPPSILHGMAYDASRVVTTVFGGGFGTALNDTWEWDGADWTLRSPTTRPSGRGTRMSYDALRQRTVLFGGSDSAYLDDTWEWDGTTWAQRLPTAKPGARAYHAMAYYSAAQRTVVFGGDPGWFDTWEWDGTTWRRRPTPTSAVTMLAPSMAYDSTRQRTVLVGDPYALAQVNTFEWNGTTWEGMGPYPYPGYAHAMAYHAGRQSMVLFGGWDALGGRERDDTWLWEGTRWRLLSQAMRPSRRQWHTMEYDPVRQRIVLFGGVFGTSVELADTWEWNGSWTHVPTTVQPSPRFAHATAYDPLRQRLVLFGGYQGSSGTVLADTWEWDGSQWRQILPAQSPPARSAHGMAFDPGRGKVVLFAGSDGRYFSDTWEWDGTTWAAVSVAGQSPPSGRARMVYDTARQQLLVYSGGSGLLLQTWILAPTVPAASLTYGSGCGGALGVPLLSAFGQPILGNPSFALDLGLAPASAPGAQLVAAGAASLPLGPCTVLIDPSAAVAVPVSVNGVGFASLRLSIPSQPAWIGAQAFAQAAVLDPSAPLGLGLTQGLRMVVGD